MTDGPTCDRIVPDDIRGGSGKCQLSEDAARLGMKLAEMPPSRHDWGDIIRCPNDGCGREFMVSNYAELKKRQETS